MNARTIAVWLTLSLVDVAQGANGPAVKKSQSGICHEVGTPSYERTRTFESFDSVQQCLASGGRLPANTASKSSEKAVVAHRRSWFDAVGGKALAIVGVFALVAGAYWLSRRRRAGTQSSRIHDLEQRKWEGHRLDRKD